MSLIKRLIGQKKKKPTKKDETQQVNNAINKLRETVTLLTKRRTHSEKQIAAYNKAAQQCLKKKDRKGALAKIKLRKQVEKRVQTIENQIFNLEVQIMALDETLMNRNMVTAMTVARDAMHIENPDAMIENVENIQDDIQEALEIQNEFNQLISAPLVDYDEDELEQELAELDELDGLDIGRNINKNMGNNKKIKKQYVEEKVDEEEEEEDDTLHQMQKLEMELNLSPNDYNDKHIIDVQIVQTSSPQMVVAAC